MDAQLKKIQITPAHFDKHGEIDKDEFATLTFNVGLDTKTQQDAVLALMSVLSREYVVLEVEPTQKTLEGVA
ncbi:MAG: hypothetical protein OXI63_11605 [Candidatus Poribacteria bacterium]|nr:hypothetical protein [Candidatus Poribacteria bacterium]